MAPKKNDRRPAAVKSQNKKKPKASPKPSPKPSPMPKRRQPASTPDRGSKRDKADGRASSPAEPGEKRFRQTKLGVTLSNPSVPSPMPKAAAEAAVAADVIVGSQPTTLDMGTLVGLTSPSPDEPDETVCPPAAGLAEPDTALAAAAAPAPAPAPGHGEEEALSKELQQTLPGKNEPQFGNSKELEATAVDNGPTGNDSCSCSDNDDQGRDESFQNFLQQADSRMTKLADLFRWPRRSVQQAAKHVCVARNKDEMDEAESDFLTALHAHLQRFSMSSAFSGIDTPGIALLMLHQGLLFELQDRMGEKTPCKPELLLSSTFQNLYAIEMLSKSREELCDHPHGPCCIFQNMNDFWKESVQHRLAALTDNGMVNTVLKDLVRTSSTTKSSAFCVKHNRECCVSGPSSGCLWLLWSGPPLLTGVADGPFVSRGE